MRREAGSRRSGDRKQATILGDPPQHAPSRGGAILIRQQASVARIGRIAHREPPPQIGSPRASVKASAPAARLLDLLPIKHPQPRPASCRGIETGKNRVLDLGGYSSTVTVPSVAGSTRPNSTLDSRALTARRRRRAARRHSASSGGCALLRSAGGAAYRRRSRHYRAIRLAERDAPVDSGASPGTALYRRTTDR